MVSAVLAAMGLLREGLRLGGEADDWDPAERAGEVDFLIGTGIGRTIPVGLTADGEREPGEDCPRRTTELLGEVAGMPIELLWE